MEEKKEPPTTEASLRSISWHLKCLVEELKVLNNAVASMKRGSDDISF